MKNAKSFLILLIERTTPLNQRHALLFTASNAQAAAVAEILYNLGAGVVSLPKQCKLLVEKYRKLIQSITKASVKTRSKILRNKYKRICELIISARSLLLELLL